MFFDQPVKKLGLPKQFIFQALFVKAVKLVKPVSRILPEGIVVQVDMLPAEDPGNAISGASAFPVVILVAAEDPGNTAAVRFPILIVEVLPADDPVYAVAGGIPVRSPLRWPGSGCRPWR